MVHWVLMPPGAVLWSTSTQEGGVHEGDPQPAGGTTYPIRPCNASRPPGAAGNLWDSNQGGEEQIDGSTSGHVLLLKLEATRLFSFSLPAASQQLLPEETSDPLDSGPGIFTLSSLLLSSLLSTLIPT
ncbi:unnamed protein product [Pleuronectes platessa]|uniref:Uncharacterized protein n=1 Tax=Pleuronectes platessa TaxID=8262 RepID=A0A9N7UR13_PLEPL|nr:unnamed protein product [Pleuronectes platessa]